MPDPKPCTCRSWWDMQDNRPTEHVERNPLCPAHGSQR